MVKKIKLFASSPIQLTHTHLLYFHASYPSFSLVRQLNKHMRDTIMHAFFLHCCSYLVMFENNESYVQSSQVA